MSRESVELAARLRAGTLQSTDELAQALGLTVPLLQSLVGTFSTGSEPAFRLLSSDTGTPQPFSFDGERRHKVDAGTDVTLLTKAFAAHDLAPIDTDTVDPAALKAAIETRRNRLDAAAEMAQFGQLINSISRGMATMLPLVDTETEFDTPWRTELCRLLENYPNKQAWEGSTTMKPAALARYVTKTNAYIIETNRLKIDLNAQKDALPVLPISALGRLDAMRASNTALFSALEKIGLEIFSEIPQVLKKYRSGKDALKAMNVIYNGGVGIVVSIASCHRIDHALGAVKWFRSTLNLIMDGDFLPQHGERFITAMGERTREVIRQEFLPKVSAWRDFHKMYSGLREHAPAAAYKATEPYFDEIFTEMALELHYMWAIEQMIAKGKWSAAIIEKLTRKDMETLTKDVSAQRLDTGGAGESREAKIFLSDLDRLERFSDCQIECLTHLIGSTQNRNFRWISQRTVEKLHNNMTLAARAYREMSMTYAHFREVAGKPAKADEVMGALARRALMLEVAADLTRNVKFKFSTVGVISGEPADISASQDANWLPQDVVITEPEAQSSVVASTVSADIVSAASASAAPVEAAVIAAVAPGPILMQRLSQAREHVRIGDDVVAGIAHSSSQQTNPFRARDARMSYQKAHTMLTALQAELEGMDTAQRPSGMPSRDKLKKEAMRAGQAVGIMKNLLGAQSKALFWKTSDGAMERLLRNKKDFAVRLPTEFLFAFNRTDPKTGARTIDNMIQVEIDILAHATVKGQFRSMVVQTMALHCHYRSSLMLTTREDLLKVTERDIEDAHVKPKIYVTLTQKRAPRLLTESGAESTKKVDIPYGDVPYGIALKYIGMAVKKNSDETASLYGAGARHKP